MDSFDSFYGDREVKKLNFKKAGKSVKISRYGRFYSIEIGNFVTMVWMEVAA